MREPVHRGRLHICIPVLAAGTGSNGYMERQDFVQSGLEETAEYVSVKAVADALYAKLCQPKVVEEIALANMPGRSSSEVQNAFLEQATSLGFRDESRGLFSGYQTKALRPDYFLPVGDSGVLIEVERGKTTINNMDLLDFWKCHICEHADYLILMVPSSLRQNEQMSPRNEFLAVRKRMAAFFERRNHTNVRGLFLFGY